MYSTECTLTKCTVGAGDFKILLNLTQQWNSVSPKMYKLEHKNCVFIIHVYQRVSKSQDSIDKRINAEEKANVVAADWGFRIY